VVDRGFVLVATVTPGAGRPAPRLFATTITGSSFRDVGPTLSVNVIPDSLFFLNRSVGWFGVYNPADDAVTIYRTRDGGNHWRSAPAPGHVMGAPSFDQIDFINPTSGWLSNVQGTAPSDCSTRRVTAGAPGPTSDRPIRLVTVSSSPTSASSSSSAEARAT
jgi:hypothetical protein